MILLTKENELFAEVMGEFWVHYETILDSALQLSQRRGEHYDISPIHHRLPPEGLVHEITKKADRIKAAISTEGWERKDDLVRTVIREAPDIVNYAAFIGAFALQLLNDLGEVDDLDMQMALDPEMA